MTKLRASSVLSGNGNRFLLLDARGCKLKEIPFQEGLDGTILLKYSDSADYRMQIFNADRSEAEMCGNGLRCLGAFAVHLGEKRPRFTVETGAGVQTVYQEEGKISVDICPPDLSIATHKIDWDEKTLPFFFLNTGVPHAVTFVSSFELLKNFPLEKAGPYFRRHAAFGPAGTNVTIAYIGKDAVHTRTYERGVEAETGACGTGAAAVGLIIRRQHPTLKHLELIPSSGEPLQLAFADKVRLSGIIHKVQNKEDTSAANPLPLP